MPPRVSLALPVYNGKKFIAEAICSILSQDYEDFELIITDNASTDGTESICREFAASDPRVKYIRNERNLGAGPNFNLGFELSLGEYFKWCACDDKLSPDFIRACVSVLDRDQDAVLVYGTTQCIDENGRPIPMVGRMMPELEGVGPARRFKTVFAEKGTCFEIFGLFRRDPLKKTSLFRPYYGTDVALLADMSLLGTFVHVSGIVFYNREHSSRSINLDKKERILWQSTDSKRKHSLEHIILLKHLIEICIRRRQVVSPVKTLAALLVWALRPIQISRYALELIGIASPSARNWLRGAGWRVLRILHIELP